MGNPIATRLAVLAIGVALAGGAAAQANQTWVSGVGDDTNDCSRTAPCQTFAGAIAKTAAGGEIDALDPGGFGAVTITKSITIDGGATLAGVLAAGSNGITVNAGGGVVILRRLSITGNSAASTAGITFMAGAALHVEDCTVSGFAQGIAFAPAAGGQLYASNVEVSDNTGAGIALSSGSVATPSTAALTRLRLSRNDVGLLVRDNALASMYDSAAGGNASAGVSAAPSGAAAAQLNLENVVLSGSPLGIKATAPAQGSAIVRLSKVVALDVGASAQADANSRLVSFGNNRFLDPAPGPGNFTVAAAPSSPQVRAGQNAQLTITVAPGTGFTGPVTLGCSGLPAGAACSFNPASVSLSGAPAGVALTVSTVTTAGAMLASLTGRTPSEAPNPVWPLAACLIALTWWAAGTRRRSLREAPRLLPWAALCALVFLASCHKSGVGGGGGPASQPVAVTPGTYVFQVTGTAPDTAVSNLASVTLTVSP